MWPGLLYRESARLKHNYCKSLERSVGLHRRASPLNGPLTMSWAQWGLWVNRCVIQCNRFFCNAYVTFTRGDPRVNVQAIVQIWTNHNVMRGNISRLISQVQRRERESWHNSRHDHSFMWTFNRSSYRPSLQRLLGVNVQAVVGAIVAPIVASTSWLNGADTLD